MLWGTRWQARPLFWIWNRQVRRRTRYTSIRVSIMPSSQVEWQIHFLRKKKNLPCLATGLWPTSPPLRKKNFSTLDIILRSLTNELTNSMAYGTQRFNAAFTRALEYSLSWAESTQLPALIPISWRSILIISSHLRLGLPKGIFPVGLPDKILRIWGQ